MLIAVCHSDESGWTEVDDLSDISEIRGGESVLLWAEADVAHLDGDDVRVIAEEFALHPLAVEDAVHARQRPKLEEYGDDLFVVLHELDEVHGQLEAVQVACFVGSGYLLTIHAGANRTLEEAKQRWEQQPQSRRSRDHLLHVLLDTVVDDYQDIADRLEAEMEQLEEIILDEPAAPVQHQLYSLKQRLSRLRRYALPASRLMEGIVHPDGRAARFGEQTKELFRDVHDHLMRIRDQIRNIDDLSQAVLDLAQANQARVLNEVSRKLSAWAAIFAVGTLIAGVYGMNFALVPKDQTLFGFWFAIALMVLSSAGLFVYFKMREWL